MLRQILGVGRRLSQRCMSTASRGLFDKTRAPRVIAGLDEAGRGPVLGPLVVSCVLLSERGSNELAALGVRDSKKLSPQRREQLYEDIVKWSHVIITRHISANDIDNRRAQGESLNAIELSAMLATVHEAQRQLDSRYPHTQMDIMCIDSCDIKPERFGSHFERAFPGVTVFSEHKADDSFTAVGAASVVAKVQRDWAMRELEEEYGIVLGSGYPSDPYTTQFLREFFDDEGNPISEVPEFVRKSWVRNIANASQSRVSMG